MTQLRLTFDPSLLSTDEIAALNAIPNLLDRIERMVPHIRAALPGSLEAIQLAMRPGTSQGGGGVQCSDVTDRTFAAVAGREKGHTTLAQLATLPAEAVGLLAMLERLVTSQRREADAIELEQVRKAVRCQGDPTCHTNALRNGLCKPCEAEGWVPGTGQRANSTNASDARRGARPKWDALMAASVTNLQAGLEQIIEATG